MKINIKKIAELAKLTLTEEEIKKFEPQLEETLKYVDHLEEVDTANIEGTSNLTGLTNVMDEDVPSESLTQEEALANNSSTHNGLFKVKGIFQDE